MITTHMGRNIWLRSITKSWLKDKHNINLLIRVRKKWHLRGVYGGNKGPRPIEMIIVLCWSVCMVNEAARSLIAVQSCRVVGNVSILDLTSVLAETGPPELAGTSNAAV